MPTNNSSDKANTLICEALWDLLPRRIPGRVQKKEPGVSTGFIEPLIAANYPDGQRLEPVFSLQLGIFADGDEVLFEYRKADKTKRDNKGQPNLIEATRVLRASSSDINAEIVAYHNLISPTVQKEVNNLLGPLREAQKSKAEELDNREARLETREREADLDQARLVNEQDRLQGEERRLQRERERLDALKTQLEDREVKIEESVRSRVAEGVAQRTMQLEKERAQIGARDKNVEEVERRIEKDRVQIKAEREAIAAAQARFEREGGAAYIEYVNSLGGSDLEPVTRLENNPLRLLNPQALASALGERGYFIDADELRRAVVGLLTAWPMGQFIVLTGPTGVGKTQLVGRLAHDVLDAGYDNQVPVRPGWVEPADLLGFYNSMHRMFEPTPFLDRLLDAKRYADANRLYTVCLDEMNLSRIENYASDLLSQLERVSAAQEAHLDLYSKDIARQMHEEEQELYREMDDLPAERRSRLRTLSRQLIRYPACLQIPPNLVLFGTVNVDETTQMFSPKFLDRAYVLRFPPAILPEKVVPESQTVNQAQPCWPLSLERSRQLTAEPDPWPSDVDVVWTDFQKWQSGFLKQFGVHFGHRFYRGFRRYIAVGLNLGLSDVRQLGDDYFQAKVAPRIRFGRGEHVVGNGQTTKYQKLEEWLKDKGLKNYSGLAGLLDAMYQRAQSTEMVELWD